MGTFCRIGTLCPREAVYPTVKKIGSYHINSSKSFIVYQGTEFDPYITYYNHSEGTAVSSIKCGTRHYSSNSAPPTLLLAADGYLHIVYGYPTSYIKSTATLSIGSWDDRGTLSTGGPYDPHPWQDSGGTIYLNLDVSGGGTTKNTWRRSTDQGTSWGGFEYNMILGGKNCITIPRIDTNDKYHLLFATAVAADNYRNLYYAQRTIGGTWETIDGTGLGGTLTEANYATCKIFDSGTRGLSYPDMAFSQGSNPIISFSANTELSADGTFFFHVMQWDGTAWQIGTVTTGTNKCSRHRTVMDIRGTADWRIYFPAEANSDYEGTIKEYTSTNAGTAWAETQEFTDDIYLNPHIIEGAKTDVNLVVANWNSGGVNVFAEGAWLSNCGQVLGGAPTATLSGTPTSGTAPLTVQFNDDSVGTPTSWLWTFGDGTTGTPQNPSHDYLGTGSFTVILEVYNADGTDSATQADYITVGAIPVESFSRDPSAGTVPLTVQFTDESSGAPTSFSWDFGDGTTGTTENPSHVYATGGDSYTVIHEVANNYGTDDGTWIACIHVSNLVVDFSGTPTSGTIPLTVQFNDDSTGDRFYWEWDFGDGTGTTLENPSHIYVGTGTFTATLTVYDNSMFTVSKTLTDYIEAYGTNIVADFSGTPTTGTAPLDVKFNDNSTGNPLQWEWDFGDGTTATAVQNPWETYLGTGTYTVSLGVYDYYANYDSATRTNYIIIGSPPIATLSGTPVVGTIPLTVQFNDDSEGDPTSWWWTFGDGTNSALQNPSHVYTTALSYTVWLLAANDYGTDTAMEINYICASELDVDFSGTPTSGTAPLTVQFNDDSGGTPTYWLWDFGDGTTLAQQNPSHIYTGTGSYTVRLHAHDKCMFTISRIKTDYIIVGPILEATLSGTPTSGTVSLTVQFNDDSVGTPTSWLWTFGDGTTLTTENPSHIYGSVGTFDVILEVNNAYGTDSATETNYITTGPALSVDFSGTPLAGTIPLTVQFNDDSTGTPTSWLWTFGDGTTGAVENPSHDYLGTGSYTVILEAYSAWGTESATKIDYVIAGDAIVANFTGTPLSGYVPLSVQFTDESVEPAGTITSWAWDYGDGTSGTSQNPLYEYTAIGTYSATLTVTGTSGTDSEIKADYITVSAIDVNLSGTPTEGTAPLTVQFNDDSDGTTTTWDWTFGDGTTGTTENPSHIYEGTGTYTVILEACNTYGTDSATEIDYITVGAAPSAIFSGTPLSGTAPLDVQFTWDGTGTGVYLWDFGDGTTGTTQDPPHTFGTIDTYTIVLQVTNYWGTDIATKIDYIEVFEGATANFSGTPTSGTTTEPVVFTVHFYDESTGTITGWRWDFGDGTVNWTQNPPHNYLGTGSYTVCLRAYGDLGTNSATKIDYIVIYGTDMSPYATFSGTPTSGTAPCLVQFYDESTGDTITEWGWDFGDGATSIIKLPQHLYATHGTYTVSLEVTNVYGSNSATYIDYISVATGTGPIVDFSGTPTTGLAPLTVQFNDDGTGGSTWLWSFGDGAQSTLQNPSHIYQAGTRSVLLWVFNAYGTNSKMRYNYIKVGTPTAGHWQLRFRHTETSEDYLVPIEDMADFPNEMYAEELGKDEYVAEEGNFWQYVYFNKKKCKFHFMDVSGECRGSMEAFSLGTESFAVYAGTYATCYGNLLGTFYYADKRWKPTETVDGLFNFDFPIREK